MLQALIFDSFYDRHRGVIAYVRLFAGELRANQPIFFLATGAKAVCLEVGYFKPDLTPTDSLNNGEVGYVITGLKNISDVKVGDTISDSSKPENALPGYKIIAPKVFASIFPVDADDYPKLRDSMGKLALSDAALVFEPENIPALGFGFRCGFLGLLHMDIIQERLQREFDLDLVITTPSVEYQAVLTSGQSISVKTPASLPEPNALKEIREPWIRLELITPDSYIGRIIELITARRGVYLGVTPLSAEQRQILAEMPLAEMIVDFYDELKSATKGYATMAYEPIGFRAGHLVRIDILVNKKPVDPLSVITERSQAEAKGRQICEKLKNLIPRQQFEIAIQAAVGARVIARETIKALRKDVTAKLYGGDITRRMKLLEKQKKGKKRMKMFGEVAIPQKAFLEVLKK